MLLATQLSSAVFISCAIFQVDAASQHFDTNFIIVWSILVVAILVVFPCCYFASRITAKLNQIADVIYFSSWYSMLTEHQKYIPFMVAFAQRDHTFRGMNMISCSLETFVQVILLYSNLISFFYIHINSILFRFFVPLFPTI